MPNKGRGRITGRAVSTPIPCPAGSVRIETLIPWTLVKRGVKKQVITTIEAPEAAFRVGGAEAQQEREAPKETPILKALGQSFPIRK